MIIDTQILEIAANAFLLIGVLLAARNHWSTWPFGIIGCVLFELLFFQSKLYANVTLQGFFVITNFIGWWMWATRDEKQEVRVVSNVSWVRVILVYLPFAAVTALAYGVFLAKTTDAAVPVIDSGMLTLSIIAQFLLMARKIETWIFWILVNIVGIYLFTTQGLYITAGVYVLFLINAVYGIVNWRKEMRKLATDPGVFSD